MKRFARTLVGSLLAAGVLAPAAAAEVAIGVVIDGPWARNQDIRALSRGEILALTEGEFEVRFPESGDLVGDWTLATARANLERLLADPAIDLVIAWGPIGSQAACCLGELPKPLIASAVFEPELQGLPLADGASGVPNLTYVALPDTLASQLATFRRLVPFRKVAVLVSAAMLEAIPDLGTRTRESTRELGVEAVYVPAGSSADGALAALPADADAVFVWPQFQMPVDELQRLIDGLIARRLPSFSAVGGGDVERGMLASLSAEDFFPRLARRVALNVQRILLGEPAAGIPVAFEMRSRLRVNMATARAIDVSPRWEQLLEAEVLHPEIESGAPPLTLAGAVAEAVAANLDLVVRRREVAAGAQDVARSRSALLPQLESALEGATIDEERAAASFGSRPERSLVASASLSQLLFSDPALADLEIRRELQRARELELETLKLDVALAAATALLDLLRAETLVRIQRDNLEVTRSNLELARIRRTVGAANPAEVYRWESEIAGDRKALIDASSRRRVAGIALARLLHRDLAAPLAVEDVGLDDPGLLTGNPRFEGHTETPRRYEAFSEFFVREGLAAAPELARIDAAVAAAERRALAARRAYWAPTVGLRASFESVLSREGAGSSPAALFPGLALPGQPSSGWSLGLAATLPLFTGGARAAERTQADEELERLRELRAATEERIEQRIRIGMERTRASYPGVELAEESAAAARANLELVADAYARGAVPIVDLLDAQNAALVADQLAVNAVYDFLVDLMEVERAANRFDFFLDKSEAEAWFDRLDRYFAELRIPPLEP